MFFSRGNVIKMGGDVKSWSWKAGVDGACNVCPAHLRLTRADVVSCRSLCSCRQQRYTIRTTCTTNTYLLGLYYSGAAKFHQNPLPTYRYNSLVHYFVIYSTYHSRMVVDKQSTIINSTLCTLLSHSSQLHSILLES